MVAILAHAQAFGGDDLADRITAEGETDDAASKSAGCWCHQLEEALSARQREADSETRHLEGKKASGTYGNMRPSMDAVMH